MYKNRITVLFALWIGLILAGSAFSQETRIIDFDRDIQPIFENHCYECHSGGDDDESPNLMDKSETMSTLKRGEPENSDLYYHVSTDDELDVMPPLDEGIDPLSADQIATIKAWIEQDAPWAGEANLSEETGGSKDLADAEEKNLWWEGWQAAGVFHKAVVHFPIALLMISAFFALGGIFRGSFVAADVAYYCLWMGAWSAILAAALGWSFTMHEADVDHSWHSWENVIDFNENRFILHGWGGIGVALLAFIIALFAKVSRKGDDNKKGWLWCTFIVAGVVGWVGHEGGKLDDKNLYNPVFQFVDRVRGVDKDAGRQDRDAAATSRDDQDDANSKQDPADPADKQSPNENVKIDDPADAKGKDKASDPVDDKGGDKGNDKGGDKGDGG